MLEGLAAWVLNTYVGEYVENLNTKQLSIGLLQGEVELENLPLRKDALRHLDLPLEVKAGFIGRIKLQIPVSRMKSEPWVISIEKLYLVASPRDKCKYDEAAEKQADVQRKQAQLQALEDKWKAQREFQPQGDAGGYSSWFSFGTSLATNIVENIQLNVKDVHLRYEDNTTIPNCSFACGIVIKSLAAQSTDGQWVPKFVGRYDTDMMHKLVDLQNFSVYWDIDAAMVGHLPMSDLADALQREMGQSASTGDFMDHQYILEPVTAQARMKRNTSPLPLRSLNAPRLKLDIQLESIPFALSEAQYRGMLGWMKEFARHDRARKYRKWRPDVKVKESPRSWWTFAISSTLHFIRERNRQHTWDFIIQRAQDNVLYVEAYTKYLTIGSYYMESKLKTHMDKMEEDCTFEEIRTLREIVMDSMAEEQKLAEAAKETIDNVEAQVVEDQPVQGQGVFQRWFPGWGGWYGNSSEEPSASSSPPSGVLTSPTSPKQESLPSSQEKPPAVESETETDKKLEKEIMDVLADTAENNTLLKRDTVFAQLNFCLQRGTFKLLSGEQRPRGDAPVKDRRTLLELECSAIKMGFESRPRTSGLKFGISVGGLYLRDKMTSGTIMPVLISPQMRDRGGQPRQFFGSMLGGGSLLQTGTLLGSLAPKPPPDQQEEALFEMTYDIKPTQSSADYRLAIKTKPLDIVYNAAAIHRVNDFFTVKSAGTSSQKAEVEIAVAAKTRYEELKKQTQEELKQTLDELLEGDDKIKAKRWDFDFDISAPQFVIPEDCCDPNSILVKFDLGHLQFHNSNRVVEGKIAREMSEDTEDDFVTPSTTPPRKESNKGDMMGETGSVADVFSQDLSESALHELLYDKYTLNLSELQVMVGRAKDNWKHAHLKGTSHMHVVDKFSITLQFERRLLYTSDPQWPKATLSGTLPSLILHINEQKIQALRNCSTTLSWSSPTSETPPPPDRMSPQKSESEGLDRSIYSMHHTYNKSIASIPEAVDEQTQEAVAASRLLLMQFAINHVSLEVQSRKRSVAELQVCGVKANVTRHTYDTSMSLTIHSLLVVDALQTFGPDFELLVASHKSLCLDSRSGSIRGSDPSSPLSPHSPQSPSSPMEQEPPFLGKKNSFHSVQAAVSTALQSLIPNTTGGFIPREKSPSPAFPFGSTSSPRSPDSLGFGMPFMAIEPDTEALIKLELFTISPNCPGNSSEDQILNVANLQFNNLDFVANQQTIVELLGFFRRVMPGSASKKVASSQPHHLRQDLQSDKAHSSPSTQASGSRLQLTAEFHRLNVLLMRAEKGEQVTTGKKVATATLSNARIQAKLEETIECDGSLGGMQLQNLTPEGTRHTQVVSVGVNPDVGGAQMPLSPDFYSVSDESLLTGSTVEKAFTFSFIKPSTTVTTPVASPGGANGPRPPEDEAATVTLRMASLCYSHSPAFLEDVSLCVTEFQDYMSSVGSTIKVAAAGVAMGWMKNRPDLLGMSMYGSNMSLDYISPLLTRSRARGVSVSEEREVQFAETVHVVQKEDDPEPVDSGLKFKVDVILQTPVIMLPRKPQSSEVLVAHLGEMTLWNTDESHASDDTGVFHYQATPARDKIHLIIKDMSMYSVNLDCQRALQEEAQRGLRMTASTFSTPQPGGYKSVSYGTPILHETALELTIQKVDTKEYYLNPSCTLDGAGFPSRYSKPEESAVCDPETVLEIKGRVVTPFQWVLSKQVYEQILETLDNITPEEHVSDTKDVDPNLCTMSDEPMPSPEPTTSALKFEERSFGSQTGIKDKPAAALESHDSAVEDKPLAVRANFEMPTITIKMIGDLGEKEKGLVDINLQDFKVQYTKSEIYAKTLEISLQSLVMEDLLQKPDSQHRYLMVSRVQSQPRRATDKDEIKHTFLSTSCPNSMIEIPVPPMPASLPSSLNTQHVFVTSQASARKSKSEGACPSTPPPSFAQSRRSSIDENIEDKLVKIKVTLVDRKYPEYTRKYNKTNRVVEVDFACLDTTINLQTWVVLLDFLGMGAKVHSPEQYSKLTHQASDLSTRPTRQRPEEVVNTEVELKVQSLTLTLNKPEYALAKANVSAFGAHVSLRDGNFSIIGQLGSMSLSDQSPHGDLYRERFVTTGRQALDFNIFKYGLPDPDLKRDYDICVHMRMASVRYVHTHRFLQEVLAFMQHFNQLQDLLGRMRAASAGQKISETAFRGSRISMDIEAGAPIMLIPHSSRSTDILVMNMGNLTVKNTFLLSGASGTIATMNDGPKQAPSGGSSGSNATVTAENNSCTSDLTFLSCASGATGGAIGGGFDSVSGGSDAMTQSLYGSLDEDWRSGELQSSMDSGSAVDPVSPPGSAGATSSAASALPPSSLGSYYSALGHQTPGMSSIQSTPLLNSQSTLVGDSRHRKQSEPSTDPDTYRCLLDVMQVSLVEMDLFSAEWQAAKVYRETSLGYSNERDILFPSYVAVRTGGRLLKNQCQLELQVERNLEGDLSHNVPDFAIEGALSSVHCSVDIVQYKLLRGLLEHNFGEALEEFQTPMMSQLQDPKIHTVLSGEVWKSIYINLDLRNVTVELLIAHEQDENQEASLARLDFVKSRLIFESYSDQSKDVDLVSHEISMHDTRYRDAPANARPNVFTAVLQPCRDRLQPDSLQMELHYRSNKDATRFTVLLNTMRLMGIFDWLLAVQDFLLTNAENPFKKDEETFAEELDSNQLLNMSVGSGILTKRAPVVDKVETPFELRLNVTDTELVVVESMANWDTNAVIVKSTAVLLFRPSFTERPLSCSLQSLEVFSCSLAAEDETALSIIDPMTVTMELNNTAPHLHRKSPSPTGLLDATSTEDKPPILEVTFQTLNVRLSYNDLKLFMAIMNSVPHQALQAKNQQWPKNAQPPKLQAGQISKLVALGFSEADCEEALTTCDGHLDDAAMWLTQNAAPLSPKSRAQKKDGLQISGFEVKASSICFCLIDDCQDADVPLAELTFTNIHFLQKFDNLRDGLTNFRLTGDFYNRSLSGWEPFLETWGCHLSWQQGSQEENKLIVKVRSTDVLNFNVTSVLLDQYKKTKAKWTEDYYQTGQNNDAGGSTYRRRVPFIPFAMRNQTGCPLFFATVTTSPTRISPASSLVEGKVPDAQHQVSEWKLVQPGGELPFLYEEREKIRHKNTHELKVHQVVVKVQGWNKVSPVSVDKVGIYFRQARQEKDTATSMYSPELPPARIVFHVSLEGSARKVIVVRSSLMLHNRLEDEIEVMLEDPEAQRGSPSKASSYKLKAHGKLAVPLSLVFSRIWIRPVGWSVTYCNRAIHWHHVMKPGEVNHCMRSCDTKGGEKGTYRFCVSVVRQNFPAEQLGNKGKAQGAAAYPQPGHLITFMPPVMVVNLLPIEMTYYLKNTDIQGNVKPGKKASLFSVDLSQHMELGIELENFPTCKELVIPPGTTDYKVKLRIYDTQERKLELWVYIRAGVGGSLKLSIAAPYWLVNKSGLPLVFKQDNTRHEAAGQLEEHELARSVTPLLFSYSDKEASYLCTMRVGKSVHGSRTVPQWCHKFSLERGIGVRQLHVSTRDTRPDWVYNIGIEVRQGRGSHHDTNIVTFAPRYQLDNRSSHKLAFAQRHLARGQDMTSTGHLSALSGCKLSFHWPRLDLDQLLCVRMMGDPNCRWSGGFRIDSVDSFHINMRTLNNECLFLRVDIVLQGATFFIVLTDADHMPPPYRIDNFSFVPLLYFQTKVVDESLRTFIKPLSSVPYALDEPVLPPHITLSVQTGTSGTYNLNSIANGDELYYENFIYIAFTGTFKGLYNQQGAAGASRHGYDHFVQQQELVLDVVNGNRVVLKKKETGKRSQLWRMSSGGMLVHEGLSSPQVPGKEGKKAPPVSAITYVLDISDIALRPSRETPLMLRKPDERRRSMQFWMFTEEGQLRLQSNAQCIQAKNGIFGLVDGNEAVLSSLPTVKDQTVPIETAVHRQKLQPGSGILAVKVITDGPTRVLQVTDLRNQSYKSKYMSGEDFILVEETYGKPPLQLGLGTEPDKDDVDKPPPRDLELSVHLLGGVGVSLVNRVPEELLYLNLKNIDIDYCSNAEGQLLEASIQSVQADNQLFGTVRPVLLFVTPPNKDRLDTTPAIQLSIHHSPTDQWNAEIFKHLMVSVKRLTLQIEERLLWKFLQFVGNDQNDSELGNLDENFGSQRALTAATDTKFKRYYFGNLRINTSRIVLSMLTSSDLPEDLQAIKKSVGVPLVKFEDAKVELDPFIRIHPFETSAFLLEAISLHYTEELKSQAAKILGSVDFLGNPLGLFNDVTEGISGLLKDGNVGGLFKNVTHGVSNSAAKVTGSLSDGVGILTVDDRHERQRQQIRQGHSGSSAEHLVAGIKGLGHGILGGVTSIVSQTYTGARTEGFEGFFTGFGKGVVGTVTKPVAGVLDLATGAASAVRDTSKGSSRVQPPYSRKSRCCYGPGGLLPAYSEHHASAQEYLFTLNGNNYSEMFIAIEQLRFGREDSMRVLISSEQVYFLGRSHHHDNIVLQESYEELYHCRSIPYDNKFYIELTSKADTKEGMAVGEPRRRPLVRCDSESIARKVAQQINYAKNLFDEIKQTLQEHQLNTEETL